ncbi:holin [Streptomyces malaysiensis subsp. malaysiensis]|uniref:holin n=1 Tax=Streptomyces malaysiensis TaxID=92644 RepID=UPI0024C0E114|nr:holin [Streptomyces sp. NA07423]WHX19839.1 holin [Streptomyces sp. NA07423]
MNTTAFWIATVERAIRTFAQTLIAALGLDSAGIVDAPWADGLSLAAGAALVALLTAIATSGGAEGPGLTETVRRRL